MNDQSVAALKLCLDLLEFEKEGRKLYGRRSVASLYRQWLTFRAIIISLIENPEILDQNLVRELSSELIYSFSGRGRLHLLQRGERPIDLKPLIPIFPHNHQKYRELASFENPRALSFSAAISTLKEFPFEYLFNVDMHGRVLIHPEESNYEKSFFRKGRIDGRIIHPAFAPPEDLCVLAAGEISFIALKNCIVVFVIAASGHYRPAELRANDLALTMLANAKITKPIDIFVLASDGMVVGEDIYHALF